MPPLCGALLEGTPDGETEAPTPETLCSQPPSVGHWRQGAPNAEPQSPSPVRGRDTPSPDPPPAQGTPPRLPPLPQDNGAFHNQTKGKSLKGENYVSTMAQGVGRGEGGEGWAGAAAETDRVYLFTSDTTQFDFPHKRSNNISVTVNYTPQKHIKGWPASAQPLLCCTACARISRPASWRRRHRSSAFHACMGL